MKTNNKLRPIFNAINDPRRDITKLHNLNDFLLIGIISVICGAETWGNVEGYARAKIDFLRSFPELSNGIPSHGTFNRVFSAIDSEQFESCFIEWAGSLAEMAPGQVVAIDGKTIRGAKYKGKKSPIHMVSAWACENNLVGHGRIETRICSVITDDLEHVQNKEKWASLCSLVKVGSTREFKNCEKPTESATRYHISSLKAKTGDFQKAIRSHWAIENKLHWTLDVAFGEDASRKRTGNSAGGLDIEGTHLTDLARLGKLVLLVISAFVWCYKIGIYLHKIRPLKVKKHGSKAKSIFRYGLDYISNCLLNAMRPMEIDITKFLSCIKM